MGWRRSELKQCGKPVGGGDMGVEVFLKVGNEKSK